MNVAFVYDRVNKMGGAERILKVLHEIWPNAVLYTSVYNSQTAAWANIFPKIIPSNLQKLPFAKNHHELYPYLMSQAFEQFDFSHFDIVISISSEQAKSIITKPKTKHICYLLTPTRYLWSGYQEYMKNPGFGMLNPLVKCVFPIISYTLRKRDFINASRPDNIISISKNIQNRTYKYYKRKSKVIYPPVDTDLFIPQKKNNKGEYFLIVSRLVTYKRIEVAVKAFSTLQYPLVVVGTGNQSKTLKAQAGKNISFVGSLTERELVSYYQQCIALIFTSDEDFGLTPVEAQSCGKPVIAFRKGGALETVKEGITGEFYNSQDPESLKTTIDRFQKKSYDSKECRKQAMKFSKKKFITELKKYSNNLYKARKIN